MDDLFDNCPANGAAPAPSEAAPNAPTPAKAPIRPGAAQLKIVSRPAQSPSAPEAPQRPLEPIKLAAPAPENAAPSVAPETPPVLPKTEAAAPHDAPVIILETPAPKPEQPAPKPEQPAPEAKQPRPLGVPHPAPPPMQRPEKLNFDSYGATLRNLRETNHLSLEDLEHRMLINKHYLIALEREDYKNLPPPVYIAAYIRKLGSFYRLSEEEILTLAEKVRSMVQHDLPEELEKVVVSYEQSEENDEKLRKIFIFIGLASVALISLVCVSVMLLFSHSDKAASERQAETITAAAQERRDESGFTEKELLARRAPVLLAPTVLPPRRR